MSDQNLLVKLVKKSVGLPTGESSCCGGVAPQETANQSCAEQSADVSSCCGSQESVDLQKDESSGCGCADSQATQETAKQSGEQQPATTSSCCGS